MLKGRTQLFNIWRACSRIGVLPPGVKPAWDDNSPMIQSHIVAYDQIANNDDNEQQLSLALNSSLLGSKMASVGRA